MTLDARGAVHVKVFEFFPMTENLTFDVVGGLRWSQPISLRKVNHLISIPAAKTNWAIVAVEHPTVSEVFQRC